MAKELDQELRFFFKSAGQGSASLNVVRLEGSEAISQLFRFNLILVSNNAEIDFDAMLSNTATLSIRSFDGSKEFPYHGELAEFEQLDKVNEFVFYRAVLVPRVARQSLNKINEVYLNEKSIPEVIKTVLKTDVTNNDFTLLLKDESAYRKRSFICQHQESNIDFISRWMEFEGMYYFFEHGDADAGTDKLKILDYKEGHPNQSISLKYCQTEDLQTQFQDQSVTGFICKQKPLPKTVIVQDFNYRQANLQNLKATETVSDKGRGEVMFYGDNLRTNEEAKALAKVRAQEIQCRRQIFSGDATAVGIRSGYFLELTEHYRKSFNAKYLVTEVQHFGSQAGVLLAGTTTPYSMDGAETNYRASFIAIPANTQFRAERVTLKPVIAGTMSAIVDSDGSGNHADINEYGQYKVQLLYDLSEKHDNKGSAFVRMASPYAGSRNGMNFPLLKGTEVLLSFIGGDPDQPVIIGAVPNSENPNILNNQNSHLSGIRSPSGQQIVFSNEPGQRSFHIYSDGAFTGFFSE
jgi:type VI secretion system secreted protein VgrG